MNEIENFEEEGYEIDDFPKGYTYKFVEDEEAKMTIRIKEVKNEEDALEWLKRLNDVGLVIWRVQRTFPRVGKKPISNLFKQDMRCQHKASHKVCFENRKRLKNTDCPAIMTLLVKRTNIKYSRAAVKDILLKEWPCIVKFVGKHNHNLFTNHHVEVSDELRQKIYSYFLKGHSPTSTIRTLWTDLLVKQPDSSLIYQTVPDRATCSYLYNVEFKADLSGEMVNLESLVKIYNETKSGKAVLGLTPSGHRFVTLCSALMTRVHQLVPQSSELMFVDVAKSRSSRLYSFFTVTPAGGLPMGVILTDVEDDDVFDRALQTLRRECFTKEQFYGKDQPHVIMSGECACHRKVLEKHFPKSCFLTCQRSVVRRTWSWALDPKNSVDKHDRGSVLRHVKELMYSYDEDRFNKNLRKITAHHVMSNYPKFSSYLDTLCEEKQMWASCFRTELPLRGHHTFGYVEPSIKVLRELVTGKKMNFNMTQIFDFISVVYEKYVTKILENYSNGNFQLELIRHQLPVTSQITEDDIIKHPMDGSVFVVKNAGKSCSVNVLRFTCSCSQGVTGNVCQHLCAILEHKMMGTISTECFNVAQTRKFIFQVASGKTVQQFAEADVEPVEMNCLQTEMGFGYDHEELIQSEDASITKLGEMAENNEQLSKDGANILMPALRAVMMLNASNEESKNVHFTLYIPPNK